MSIEESLFISDSFWVNPQGKVFKFSHSDFTHEEYLKLLGEDFSLEEAIRLGWIRSSMYKDDKWNSSILFYGKISAMKKARSQMLILLETMYTSSRYNFRLFLDLYQTTMKEIVVEDSESYSAARLLIRNLRE